MMYYYIANSGHTNAFVPQNTRINHLETLRPQPTISPLQPWKGQTDFLSKKVKAWPNYERQ